MTNDQKILIIGLSAGGAADLSPRQTSRILAAEVLVGGRRHLSYFPDFAGETVPVTGKLEPVIERLQQAVEFGQRAVVLSSGDPLFHGIGATLRRHFRRSGFDLRPRPRRRNWPLPRWANRGTMPRCSAPTPIRWKPLSRKFWPRPNAPC